jgi:MATE family multidrug resistance protein
LALDIRKGSLLIYLAAHYILEPRFAGVGVWMAFLIYYIARGLTMLPAWTNIKRDLRGGETF